mmetsp:Transcript_2989/g.6202  ORF Transcript_2989/g.6202 Transcript_2989/m.6202 type:complete len:214 (+) Transcript_2989:1496-2137(+)
MMMPRAGAPQDIRRFGLGGLRAGPAQVVPVDGGGVRAGPADVPFLLGLDEVVLRLLRFGSLPGHNFAAAHSIVGIVHLNRSVILEIATLEARPKSLGGWLGRFCGAVRCRRPWGTRCTSILLLLPQNLRLRNGLRRLAFLGCHYFGSGCGRHVLALLLVSDRQLLYQVVLPSTILFQQLVYERRLLWLVACEQYANNVPVEGGDVSFRRLLRR